MARYRLGRTQQARLSAFLFVSPSFSAIQKLTEIIGCPLYIPGVTTVQRRVGSMQKEDAMGEYVALLC